MIATRRTFLGFLIATAAAPAPAILVHDKRVTLAFEIVSEEWMRNPFFFDTFADGCYRVLARCGDKYAYGTCLYAKHPCTDLHLREHIREEAKHSLRIFLANKVRATT